MDDLFNLSKVAEDFTKIMSYYFAKPYLLLPTATEQKFFIAKRFLKQTRHKPNQYKTTLNTWKVLNWQNIF